MKGATEAQVVLEVSSPASSDWEKAWELKRQHASVESRRIVFNVDFIMIFNVLR
jgi:hypothetical protein